MELPLGLPADTTKLQKDRMLLTNGGRVITATALAPTIQEAAVLATSDIGQVKFERMYYRKEIRYVFK